MTTTNHGTPIAALTVPESPTRETPPRFICGPTCGCGKSFDMVSVGGNLWGLPEKCPHCGKDQVTGGPFLISAPVSFAPAFPMPDTMVMDCPRGCGKRVRLLLAHGTGPWTGAMQDEATKEPHDTCERSPKPDAPSEGALAEVTHEQCATAANTVIAYLSRVKCGERIPSKEDACSAVADLMDYAVSLTDSLRVAGEREDQYSQQMAGLSDHLDTLREELRATRRGADMAKERAENAESQLAALRRSREEDRRGRVLAEVAAERAAQDAQWGGPAHDDRHTRYEWQMYRRKFEAQAGSLSGNPPWRIRFALVKIAALAVAQVEAMDRLIARTSSAARTPETPGTEEANDAS